MPLPKNSKFVRDGEVDPGVEFYARALIARFTQREDLDSGTVAAQGESFNGKETYYSVLAAWFIASCGWGLFSYTNPDALYSIGTGRGEAGKGQPGSVNGSRLDDIQPESFNGTLIRYPQYAFMFSGGVEFDVPADLTISDSIVRYTEHADKLYRTLFAKEPNVDLIVEALMFYDPTGIFGHTLERSSQEKGVKDARDQGLYIAQVTASGVPLLGKKWIIADLVSRGESPEHAANVANDVYKQGGNYYAFKDYVARNYAVRAILKQVDPFVSDQQILDIANSPLPLEVVETVARNLLGGIYTTVTDKPTEDLEKDEGKKTASTSDDGGGGGPAQTSSGGVTGTAVVAAAGAGVLAGFALGGPIGLAVGAGVLLLSSLVGGSKS